MKRTVELDTVEIADKLGELASKVRLLALAANGIDCFDNGGGGQLGNGRNVHSPFVKGLWLNVSHSRKSLLNDSVKECIRNNII